MYRLVQTCMLLKHPYCLLIRPTSDPSLSIFGHDDVLFVLRKSGPVLDGGWFSQQLRSLIRDVGPATVIK